SGVNTLAQGVRGCCPTRESQLPSSAEEGKADAVAAAGVVLVKKIIILISTTPSARAKVASQLFLCRPASPPRLRMGAAVRTLGNSPLRPGLFSSTPLRGCRGAAIEFSPVRKPWVTDRQRIRPSSPVPTVNLPVKVLRRVGR